jgi:hypothetical protein
MCGALRGSAAAEIVASLPGLGRGSPPAMRCHAGSNRRPKREATALRRLPHRHPDRAHRWREKIALAVVNLVKARRQRA